MSTGLYRFTAWWVLFGLALEASDQGQTAMAWQALVVAVMLCTSQHFQPSFVHKILARGPGHHVAVHEAGHAILAWRLPVVTEVTQAEIDLSLDTLQGFVLYTAPTDPPLFGQWQLLTICLGGIAAETVQSKFFKSGRAESDLLQARSRIRTILSLDPTGACPWVESALDPTRIDLSTAFKDPLSEQEARVLHLGYRAAKTLIRKDKIKTRLLAERLQKVKILREKDLEALLGPKRT
jgi:ATP-dependent Zn protease